jgi:hypothetical protein
MARPTEDPISTKLDAILTTLQDLFILEGTKAGIKREDLRRILSVSNDRVSRIMKHVKSTSPRS